MAAWPIVALAEVATVERSGVQPEQIKDGTIYVGLEHIESGGALVGAKAVDAGVLASSKFRFNRQHVLYGKLRPYLSKIACPDFSGICSTDILPILPGPRLERRYLFHFLRQPSMVDYASSRAVGLNLPRLSPSVLEDFQIPLPPLVEQRRIAEVLDCVEALRAKRRAGLDQLGALKQALFLELFGDPATNPKAWLVVKIGDLLESASYGTSEKSRATGEFPVLRMNNITRTGEIDLSELKFMDLNASQRERYLVRAGDVLFNRTNSAELVGKTAIFREASPMAYAGYLVRLRMNGDNEPEYLSSFLNTPYSKRMLRNMCKSIIGMANINATEIQAMRIPRPDLRLQREFARRVASVEKLRTLYGVSKAKLEVLFAAVQHRAFRGAL